MAVTITAPAGSFVQFTEMDYEHCTFGTVRANLPVLEAGDIAFQFMLSTDTIQEADELAAPGSTAVTIGIASVAMYEPLLLTFDEVPERYRIDDTHILYNWTHGLTDFDTVVEIGECFKVRIDVTITNFETAFTSNQFYRINAYDACHTSVIEYGSNDNGFGFNYCASATPVTGPPPAGGGGEEEPPEEEPMVCTPTHIRFTNMSTFTLPYTASLLAAYGNTPTVQVWIADTSGELVKSEIQIKMDGFPPTQISFDFGGNASGLIIIK